MTKRQGEESQRGTNLGEWKIHTVDAFRTGLASMMAFRKMNQDDLGWKMGDGTKRRNIFSAFLSGKQADLKFSSVLDSLDAMDLEMVVRRKTDKGDRARAALKAERERARAAEAAQVQAEQFEAEGRDAEGKLKTLTPRQKAEAEALLESYDFSAHAR